MKRIQWILKAPFFLYLIIAILASSCASKIDNQSFQPPISFENADQRAQALLDQMTIKQKIELTGGYSRFFIQSFPELGIPYIFMSDATQGVRLSAHIEDSTIVKPLQKSTAFPAPILLSSTWNPCLAKKYATSVGEECRAGGVHILLGPGLNLYRQSQCGRNFEYFGEDPYLTSRMIEKYVLGVQSTGTSATLKHFVANNTDFYRRRSNSIMDERTLNEIYLPGFKAGIDAGVMAVMTSYNKLNGEWCGQSDYVINDILRGQLGFKWLVMSDWTSVYDGEKVIKSGQDLEMPYRKALANTEELLDSGKVTEAQINRMAKSILRMNIAMGFYDRPQQDTSYLARFEQHEKVALDVAREGIILLKNDNHILPIQKSADLKIVATGKYLHQMAFGGGSALVKGYNPVTLAKALKNEFADNIEMVDISDSNRIAAADLVLLSTGTFFSEGKDVPFDLPDEELKTIHNVLELNENSVVIVNSGSGSNMSPWIDNARAVLYAWYGGQIGNIAIAEILSGKVNPSGKLPITIEKRFKDSPGYGYLPDDETLYDGWVKDNFTHREYDIEYREGIFVGYRWYEHKNIEPLFAFGHGLSYAEFEYSDLKLSKSKFSENDKITVSFMLKNTGIVDGTETAQLYVHDVESSHPRPVKELKGFRKIWLAAGEAKKVTIDLDKSAFSYWNPDVKQWFAETGEFEILVGSASDKILLKKNITLK